MLFISSSKELQDSLIENLSFLGSLSQHERLSEDFTEFGPVRPPELLQGIVGNVLVYSLRIVNPGFGA